MLRWAFRLAMAALVLLLAMRTYEETGVAHARSNGTLHTVGATITKLTSRTTSGRDGGGQDGGSGDWTVTTKYTIELRVGDGTKTVNGVPDDSANGFQEGQRVRAGLWHGRVVEIDGRDVWLGWHPEGRDLALFVLYPLIAGYLMALALAAAAYLVGLDGRGRLERRERAAPWAFGFLVAVVACFVLLGCAAFGNTIAYWPLVPLGVGTATALAALSRVLRRARTTRVEDSRGGSASAQA
ncbi:hypothetical protein CW362_24225 [Streptomyces populi]|uniref:DUF3592 domain-containing protein n=1 Tax=Streptomyces populi TaxID=2058924 RepID=A0A2I0SKK8_9ACTN|nr:hypothetical protein CW362_24225 [Streptomyces populi]